MICNTKTSVTSRNGTVRRTVCRSSAARTAAKPLRESALFGSRSFRAAAAVPSQPRAARASVVTSAAAPATLEGFGESVFTGAVAEKYLSKYGESATMLEDPSWTTSKADVVAKAVCDWAVDNGATVYCHLFQPMGSSGVRHGMTSCVQLSMLEFDSDMRPRYEFEGKALLKGETDGSSYPNGGMRATHTAGGYLAIDPESPIFLRGDTVFIPACFVAYTGQALDEKTPLLRAVEAMSKEGTRLLKLLGVETAGLVNNIGLEQEFFLVPREQYYRRPDLQLTGRTVMGYFPARGQEMSDHYMGPLTEHTPALNFYRELQAESFKMGIPLKTRHREVAPNQFECAPLFGPVAGQVDQNLMVMQLIEEVAARNGLAALLQEKPFSGINGSGKHNNWSLSTKEGAQLFNPNQFKAKTGKGEIFPIIMAAIVSAIDKHGDLMRMSIASPGNDFRLGAMEAPPAVISTYLGEDMTTFLEAYEGGGSAEYTPGTKTLGFGVSSVAPIEVPAEDRNRTSPFPYGGARFEYRAAGSAQNASMINTVLNAITAEAFKVVADRIEAGEDAKDVARSLLADHKKAIFNGNGYDPSWPDEAVAKGVWRIDSGVEAMKTMTSEKNVKMFGEMGVLTPEECAARETVMLEHYAGSVIMEAGTMANMITQGILPMCKEYKVGDIKGLEKAAAELRKQVHAIEEMEPAAGAEAARELRLNYMIKVRDMCDDIESNVDPAVWPFASYKDLLFLDSHENAYA